jgi:hypothetical protein
MRSNMSFLTAAAAVVGLSGAALAQVPWAGGMDHGNASFFDWANGQNSATNLFGTPFLAGSGDTFFFTPAAFVANAHDGQTVHATDTFQVDLFVHAGFKFDGIRVQEFGDYQITTTGTPVNPSSVSSSAVLGVQEIGGAGRSASTNLGFPGLPVSSFVSVSDIWTGAGDEDLTLLESGGAFTAIHISVSNDLIAISGGNGQTAEIRKTVFGGTMAVTIVPAPGAAGVLGLSGLLVARRRRRA